MAIIGNHKIILTRGLSLLLAGLYLVVNLSGPLHELFDHVEAENEICDIEEADACHFTLAHSDATNGCDHESHFSKEVLSCELCSLLSTPFHITGQDLTKTDDTYLSRHLIQINTEVFIDSYVGSFSQRGPPVIS